MRGRSGFAVVISLLGLVGLATAAEGQNRKPQIIPGLDPGGPAVALVSEGIDYTVPEIAARLARDGEGDILGIDLVDGDNRPYAPSNAQRRHPNWNDGTAMARLIAAAGARIVPVRINPEDPVSIARGLAFAVQTPARIAVVAATRVGSDRFDLLAKVADQMKDVLVVVPASFARSLAARLQAQSAPGEPPANLLGILGDGDVPSGGAELAVAPRPAPGMAPLADTDRAAQAAATIGLCIGPRPPGRAAELRSWLIEQARQQTTAGLPVLERCSGLAR